MDLTDATAALLKPFPPRKVGKLPKITCRDCSKAPARACTSHDKRHCKVCGNYITEKHVHLDYVGHADVTRRLLDVDPSWTWEPVAFDTDGLPAVAVQDGQASLWIRLTVAGVTRIGVGTCPAGKQERDKELIGDAIRNAAMRFGVALDLWAKEPPGTQSDTTPPPAAAPSGATPITQARRGGVTKAQLRAQCVQHGITFEGSTTIAELQALLAAAGAPGGDAA